MTDIQEGQTATNPRTGQKIIFKGGQWVSAGSTGAPMTLQGDARNAALQKIAALKLLSQQAARSRHLYDYALKGTGIRQVLSEYNPLSPAGGQFDASVDGLTPLAKAAFRVPGSGADSDKESDAFMKLFPDRWSFDGKNEQRYRQMDDIINSSIAEQNQLLGVKPQAAAPVAAGPVKIGGDAEYAKLPSGTVFVGPDGKPRRKP